MNIHHANSRSIYKGRNDKGIEKAGNRKNLVLDNINTQLMKHTPEKINQIIRSSPPEVFLEKSAQKI